MHELAAQEAGGLDNVSNGRDTPRSVVSDDVEGKERDHRENSIGSDSDVVRSGQ